MFPKLRSATFSSPPTAALFVPFVHRMGSPYNYKILLNDPDRTSGSEVTQKNVHAALERASTHGYLGVTRRNYNIFTVEFDGPRSHEAVRISLPTSPSVTPAHVEVHGEHMLRKPPRVFACDATHLSVDPDTIPDRVCECLTGPHWSPTYSLLIQETHDRLDSILIYVLRFPFDCVAPGIEKFYFPLDADESEDKIWGVFVPIPVDQDCIFCHKNCQRKWVNECPFARVVGDSSGVQP